MACLQIGIAGFHCCRIRTAISGTYLATTGLSTIRCLCSFSIFLQRSPSSENISTYTLNMAAVAVQQPFVPTNVDSIVQQDLQVRRDVKTVVQKPRDIFTTLNYYKDPEDGSPPHPTYVDRPETYDRPFEAHPVTVHDIGSKDHEYSLDVNGFQVHRHDATEKDFLNDDQIKKSYYPETEQLLKDV